MGDSPSFVATQDECGRVAHTPIADNGSNKPPKKQGAVASQMQPTVVAIETFPLMLRHLQQTSVGNEPKKSPLQYAAGFVEIGSEVSPRLSDGE